MILNAPDLTSAKVSTAPRPPVKQTVFIVDGSDEYLAAGTKMLADDYAVYPMQSADMMFGLLESVDADLILLDADIPGMNGYEAIWRLKHAARWNEIPVIILSSDSGMGGELKGLSLGASDFVTKPFSAPLLMKRIENCLEMAGQKKRIAGLNDYLDELLRGHFEREITAMDVTLDAFADLAEFRGWATSGHNERVGRYIEVMLRRMISRGVYPDETRGWNVGEVRQSAKLHDIGKIGISDEILLKPGRLTAEETAVMRTHVARGVEAISRIACAAPARRMLEHASRMAASHHERWDGAGYPNGLAGRGIPREGRLMAAADAYDAMVSPRPYREPADAAAAVSAILDGAGAQFDPCVSEICGEASDELAAIARAAA